MAQNIGMELTGLDVYHAKIVATASGATEVVAAAPNHEIRVLAYVIVTDTAESIKFQSASTDLTGVMAITANGGISAPFNPAGWFETVKNEALNINLATGTIVVGGHVTYVLC